MIHTIRIGMQLVALNEIITTEGHIIEQGEVLHVTGERQNCIVISSGYDDILINSRYLYTFVPIERLN